MTGARAVRLPAAGLAAGNNITLCEVGGHRVGVLRVAGELHAVADRCPHRGAPICTHGELVADVSSYAPGSNGDAEGKARLLRCPWHKWDYDPTTGICPAAPKYRLKRYHVWEDGGDVVVSLDPRSDDASGMSA
jgi:nitrite reductase/ring-hydroxylating ferredoxin subunit